MIKCCDFFLCFSVHSSLKPWFLSDPLTTVHGALSPVLHGYLNLKQYVWKTYALLFENCRKVIIVYC